MKTILLTTIFLLFLVRVSLSQNVSLFPDSGVYWTNSVYYSYKHSTELYSFGVIGDTTINSKVYKKIYRSNDPIWNPLNSSYICAIRQHQEKWMLIAKNDTTQYLLYDFMVSVGDILSIKIPPPLSWQNLEIDATILGIDSVLLEGVYRKRILVRTESWRNEYWIEGIGSTNGLFQIGHFELEVIYKLRCYHEKDTLVYLNSPNNDCFYNSTYAKELNPLTNIKLYPNPVSNELTIELDKHSSNQSKLDIYNSRGQLIDQITAYHSTIRLNLSEYDSGIYLFKFYSKNEGPTTQKIIIE